MNSKVESRNQKEKPLGAYLVEAGIISLTQLYTALDDQKVSRKRLGEILADRSWVKMQTIEYLMEKVVLPERRAAEKQLSHPTKNGSHNLAVGGQASLGERQGSDSLLLLAIPSQEIEFHVSPRRTIRFLLFLVLGLVLAGFVGQFTVYFLPDYPLRDLFAALFYIDNEANIPALYSASALLFCSILLAIIAYAKEVAGDRYVRHWGALSIIFACLSLDEFISLHEKMAEPVRSALNTSGFLYFAWVIPGAIFVIICLLAFLGFLTALPAKTRRIFLVAGTVFITGAIGTELVGGYYSDFYGQQNMAYTVIATIEEFLEMLGIVIFIYALLSYISLYMKGVSLRINFVDDRKLRQSA